MQSYHAKKSFPIQKATRLSSLFLLTASIFFAGTPGAQAGSPAFIEHVRVGLHQKTVRIVLTLDRRPSSPVVKKQITARPEIRLPGVMPGATVHRRLLVRNPSFRRYLSAVWIDYDPTNRSTRLSLRFVHPVGTPHVFVLNHPMRLVLDYPLPGKGAAISPGTSPRKSAAPHKPHRIVIPGKTLPSPHKSVPAPGTQAPAAPELPTSSPPVPSEGDGAPRALNALFSSPVHRFRVVLDAGHGGKDCGTTSVSGVCEKTLVLDIVKRLAAILSHDHRFSVILTRKSDRFIPLPERTRIANENRGDLFLSVHANADPDRSVRGIETFLLNLHSSDPRAQRIAQRENSALGVSRGDLSAILLTLKINHKKKRSWELANVIDRNLSETLRSNYPVRDLGIRQAPFYVIMGTTMPAVLAEVNFLSNRTDAGMMDSSRFREETARGLYRGIVAYYRTVHPEERALRASAHVAGGGFAP
jgi:N-acetylmuramoyl-L-alanine amidase